MLVGELAELAVVGGHPALDLANTVAPRPPGPVELEFLPDAAHVLEWARRVGVVDGAEAGRIERAWSRSPGSTDAALADVLALRALIDPVLAGQRLDTLTRRWATAISRSELVPAGQGAATLVIGTEPTLMIPDRLADAVVDLLRTVDLSRLRTCPLPEGGCGWLFLDRSRNGSRKWCSMDDCGTQAKSRRLTARRRAKR